MLFVVIPGTVYICVMKVPRAEHCPYKKYPQRVGVEIYLPHPYTPACCAAVGVIPGLLLRLFLGNIVSAGHPAAITGDHS